MSVREKQSLWTLESGSSRLGVQSADTEVKRSLTGDGERERVSLAALGPFAALRLAKALRGKSVTKPISVQHSTFRTEANGGARSLRNTEQPGLISHSSHAAVETPSKSSEEVHGPPSIHLISSLISSLSSVCDSLFDVDRTK